MTKPCPKCDGQLSNGIAIFDDTILCNYFQIPKVYKHPLPIVDVIKCEQCGYSESINIIGENYEK